MPFDPSRYATPNRPYLRVDLPDRTWPEKVISRAPIWCSVDLRDGNQALPDPMGHDRKRALLELLLKVGFREIELGFPSASQTDFDFIRWVVEERVLGTRVTPQVITQSREALITRTLESIAGAPRAIVHLYNSTSELQRRVVFGMSRREILELAVHGTKLIRAGAEALTQTQIQLQYSPESFTGTELDFAVEVCDAVAEAWGATPDRKVIINLPSTVEMTTPNVFADRIEWMGRKLRYRDSMVLSVHTHNDRGTGVASAELAVLAGADRIEGTLLGNGERSGNVDIVTLAMNLYSQGIDPELDFSNMPEVVRVVEQCTRLPVHPRHSWAGELVFTAFSGSHQDAIHKGMKALAASDKKEWEVPYLPIDPQDIGREYESVIRINSQSGKSGIAHVLERDHGYRVPKALAVELGKLVQAVTDETGQELSSEDVVALFERSFLAPGGDLSLLGVGVERRADGKECAVTAKLSRAGEALTAHGIGNGPIDAFVNALTAAGFGAVNVVDYSEHGRSSGASADAIAYVSLRLGDPSPGESSRVMFGVGSHADVVMASFHAIVTALNRFALTRVRAA